MREVWFCSSPGFKRNFIDAGVICSVQDVTRMEEGVAPEFDSDGAAVQEVPDHVSQGLMGRLPRPFWDDLSVPVGSST